MSDTLQFRISSSLKNIIGKDLITDDFIAVFELVKNSFDAHASIVDIYFENEKIIIQDNGKGMSLSDIQDKWLFVAYSAKKEGVEDNDLKDSQFTDYRSEIKAKRYYAGAKGIGRFSCDRLGENLLLTTRKVNSDITEKIKVNWKSFEQDSSTEFVNISVEHETVPNEFENGTKLEISGITESWNRKKIQNLKYSLEKLINPLSDSSAEELDDFKIVLHSVKEVEADEEEDLERNKINGPIKNFIFETLKVKTTHIKTTIKNDSIITELIDRGTSIYHVKEKNKFFPLLKNVTIHLFYLNQAAKINFTRQMGVRAKSFGSVFLFKNGFRVYPFGDVDDDSFGIDYRKQQGHSRFLGTREVVGRILLSTDDDLQFRETSSRDGGLVKTDGYFQLRDAFIEKGLKTLERYVVNVQWGVPFISKGYEDYKEMLREDKESEDISIIKSNLGSRAELAEIIRKMADDDQVEIISYNKDLINIIFEKLDAIKPEVFTNLRKIADKTNDNDFRNEIDMLLRKYENLLKDAADANNRAEESEKKRLDAEERERKSNEIRFLEEQRRKKAEEAERLAKIEIKEKELLRRESDIKRYEAERKAKEQQEARQKAESNLRVEKDKNTYLNATRKTLSEDAEDLIHSIKVSVIGIDAGLESLIEKIKSGLKDDVTLLQEISRIRFITDKVMKLSKLITKSNFKADQEVRKVDIVKFIREYIDTYSYAYQDKIKIEFKGESNFITRLSILDLSVILDNLISNSYKALASKIIIEVIDYSTQLEVLIHDNGNGVAGDFIQNTNVMFDLGAKSDVEGSGIGLYSAKRKMTEIHGNLEFVGNGILLKGATFKLTFK